MSPSSPSLPIIDPTPYFLPLSEANVPEARKKAAKEIYDATRQFGFFYLRVPTEGWHKREGKGKGGRVDAEEAKRVLQLAREFFARPNEEKERLAIKNSDMARGYQRLGENVTAYKADYHEGLDMYRPVTSPPPNPSHSSFEGRYPPLQGPNQWPDVEGFRETYESWMESMKELGMVVMLMMGDGLGMEEEEKKQLLGKVNDSFWVMRAIGYPPLPPGHNGYSCGAHRDYGCLTFLLADSTKGALQVLMRDPNAKLDDAETDVAGVNGEDEKGQWIGADPIDGCVVVNIGDMSPYFPSSSGFWACQPRSGMWDLWTASHFPSTLHRVIHRGTNYRVSIPFFFEPNYDTFVEPLPSALRILERERSKDWLQREMESGKWKGIRYGDWLMGKVTNNFAVED